LTEPGANRIKKTEKQILRVFLSTRLLICQLKKGKTDVEPYLIPPSRWFSWSLRTHRIAARPVHLPVPLHSKHRKPGPSLPFSSRDTDPSLSSGRWEPQPSRHGLHELVHRVTKNRGLAWTRTPAQPRRDWCLTHKLVPVGSHRNTAGARGRRELVPVGVEDGGGA